MSKTRITCPGYFAAISSLLLLTLSTAAIAKPSEPPKKRPLITRARDLAIHGKVDSFAPATGQEFALIPVENAVGNFTKITQRLPVKIVVDRSQLGQALRPGLSVEIKVDVRDRSGPSFAEAGQATPQVARQGVDR